MAIKLEKGQRINLEKSNGLKLTNFCVGCNWGMIETYENKEVVVSEGFLGLGRKTEIRRVPVKVDVDIDLSCIMTDGNGKMLDYIYSPQYKPEFLNHYGFSKGQLTTRDSAIHHTGDDTQGDADGDDGLDNEIITVDLEKVSNSINNIYFFLNIYDPTKTQDFSKIPYAAIRMYEGTPSKVKEVYASYDVAADPQYSGKLSLIMGKLYRHDSNWKFAAIGDAFDDANLCLTMKRILNNYK